MLRPTSLLRSVLLLLGIVLLLTVPLVGQSPTGLPPFGSFSGGGVDTINVQGGNLHLTIPLLSKTGRGLPFIYNIGYDSTVWSGESPDSWHPAPNWGWTFGGGPVLGYVTYYSGSGSGSQGCSNSIIYSFYFYSDASDTVHSLQPPPGANGLGWPACPLWPSSGIFTTTDGSGITANISVVNNQRTITVPLPSGITVVPPLIWIPSGGIVPPGTNTNGPGSITDTNGNQITTTNGYTFTDTLGTTVLNAGGNTYSYTGGNGATSITLTYSQFTVATNFGCANDRLYPIPDYPPTPTQLLTAINFPDGSSYSFTYEQTSGMAPDVTARIASVTLPTGGIISYTYGTTVNCRTAKVPGIATRTTPDGQWTNGTKTDPAGNDTVYTFTTPGSFPNPAVLETQRKIYQGSQSGGTLLRTAVTCYNAQFSYCGAPGYTVYYPITQTDTYTILPNGQQSLVETKYDTNQQVTEIKKYDFGVSMPPTQTPVSDTVIQYASLGNNIKNRPSQITTTGSDGSVAQTTYAYDAGSVTTLTGTPQHISVTGSRGNATSVSQLVSGTTYLTKTFTYYDTGQVQTATDVNGAQTTYNYPDPTSTCGNAFATSVSMPLSLSTSSTWDCNGAVATTVTDANSNTTSYGHSDPFWRLTSTTEPPPLNYVTTVSYGINPSTSESILNFNGTTSTVDVLTVLDSLGRPYLTQRKQSQTATNYDTVQRSYDSNGRFSTVTVPFSCTRIGSCSSGVAKSSYQYDALNRVTTLTSAAGTTATTTYTDPDVYVSLGPALAGENPKRRQSEYDGLGRLKSVCEITSASGSGTCSQSSPQTGFWTQYTYDGLGRLTNVNQNATQTRTFGYDDLNRLTTETNPENGAVNYKYDTDATCGTYTGDLVKTVNAANVTTCSHYDALHRRTFMSNANSNSCRFFQYDTNPGFGLTENNLKGHLSGAWVGNCSTGAVTSSNLGFNYSVRGEALDTYQWSTHSGGWYDAQATYWANGALNTLDFDNSTGGELLIPTITYGADGEGRISTVSGSSLQNPVTSTSYNAASQVTAVTFGSGDSDSYQYIGPSLPMSQYNYNVGSSTVTGNLTWNPNGTLGKLVITDPLNSNDAQTCKYGDPNAQPAVPGYDDLGRLISVNCGTKWSQTFSYDPFGNITKSGSISWQPGYNTANNHYTLAGTSYDANGNLTADTFHTYTWDGNFGNPLSIDTTGLTYDALGRLTEMANGSTYKQFVYGPTGKLAIMNGQAVVKVMIALPAGDQAIYTGQNYFQGYWHSDWLGSSRLKSSTTQTKIFDGAYAPFGESYVDSGSYDHVFTGQIPGVVSDLYDFLYREYHPKQGRWISPDPSGMAAAAPANPQTWNRYGYASNKPLNSVDQLGLVDDCLGCGLSVAGGSSYGTTYIVDGMRVSAGVALSLLSSGAAEACPRGLCDGFNSRGQYVKYWAFANGGGYFASSGPGSLYYSLASAQAAGSAASFQAMVNSGIHQEWGNTTAEDPVNGVFTYGVPHIIGPSCAEGQGCHGELPLDVPDGMVLAGVQHTHPWVGGTGQFDVDVEEERRGGYTFLDYVTTPSSNGPGWGTNPRTFVLDPSVPSVCQRSGSSQFGIQGCN